MKESMKHNAFMVRDIIIQFKRAKCHAQYENKVKGTAIVMSGILFLL